MTLPDLFAVRLLINIIHHRRELFSTGLAGNPRNPCGLAKRGKLCEMYTGGPAPGGYDGEDPRVASEPIFCLRINIVVPPKHGSPNRAKAVSIFSIVMGDFYRRVRRALQ